MILGGDAALNEAPLLMPQLIALFWACLNIREGSTEDRQLKPKARASIS